MAHSFSSIPRSAVGCLAAMLFSLIARPARADIDVQLQGVEGDLRRNVETFLSVSRYRKDQVDEDTMQRLFNRIEGEVKSAVKPFGYYEPTVSANVARQGGSNWRVNVTVQPGEPVRVRELEISIEGAGEEDPVFDGIRNQPLLRIGMRLNHGTYETVKADLIRTAAANGYINANLVNSEMRVDPAAHTAGIFLRLETGPRYYFGDVTFDQNVIRPGLVQRFLRFKAGDPYSTNQLLSTQFALDDSLYFRSVDLVTGDPDPATLRVPITIRARKSRPVLSLGGGYGTDTKVRGTASWTDSRVNLKGHRLRFEIKASSTTRTVNSRYDIPIGDPALERVSAEFLNETTYADVDTSETTLRPSITRMVDRWQTVSSLSLTRTYTQGPGFDFTDHLLVPGLVVASVPDNFLGEALFSRTFWSELIGSHKALGAGTDFLRFQVQVERGIDLNFQWHLNFRGEVGTTWVDDFSRLPDIYRFYAGGDRSVRGFAYKSLSPEEPRVNDDGSTTLRDVGGKHLFTGTVELVRDLPWSLALATFFDAGNAFNKWGDALAYSAGVGVRYRLPVLSIGVDVAKPLSTGGHPRLHLNITPKL